jgi:signal transduction histidine kinase
MRWEFARTATFRMRSPKLRLSLAAQLVAAFGISVLVTLLLAAAAVWGSNRIEATTRLLKSSEHQLRALEQLATKLQKRHTAWTRFVYAGREDARREAAIVGVEARRLVNDLIDSGSAAQVADAKQPGASGPTKRVVLNQLLEFRTLLDRVDAAWWECVAERGTTLTEQARALFDEGCDKPLKQELHPYIEAMVHNEQLDVERHRDEVARTVAQVREGAYDASIFAVGVAGIALVLLWRSVEAVNKLREAEAAANETKTMFLANMSHEIRTPLNGILGFTQLLAKQQGDISDPETQDFIATIRSSGHHLLNLINDVLDISKDEAGRLEMEWGEFPLLPIFAEVYSILRPRAEAKSIGLRFSWTGPAPATIRTDPHRLKQVLLNLVGNAVKFTERGGVLVEARLERPANNWWMVVDVVDTGTGIAEDQLASIFQPFRQADSSYTRAHEGTGLGLSISERLAQKLHGTITVESAVGQGSTFTLTLDLGPLDGVELVDASAACQSTPVPQQVAASLAATKTK